MKEFRRLAIPPEAIARAIAFAIKQPGGVDVNEIIVRSTASPYQLVACAGRNNHYAKWCATRSEDHMILHILTLFAAFAAVLSLAAGAVFGPAAVAQTAAPKLSKSQAGFYRMKVGDVDVIALSDGTVPMPALEVLTNARSGEVGRLLAYAYQEPPLDVLVNAYLTRGQASYTARHWTSCRPA